MLRTSQNAYRFLTLSLLAVALYLLFPDGQQSRSIVHKVSILFTAGMGAFHEAVQYKEVTVLAAAVLLSALTILRNPVVKHR